MADDRIAKEQQLIELAKQREELEKRIGVVNDRIAARKKKGLQEHHTQTQRILELEGQIQAITEQTKNITEDITSEEKSIGNLLTKQITLQKTLNTQSKGNANLAKAVNNEAIHFLQKLKSQKDAGKGLTAVQQDNFEVLQSVLSGTNDLEGINEAIAASKKKENELKDAGNTKDLKSQQNLTNILGKEAKKLEFNEKEKAQMDILDQITGGLASKAANFADAFQKSPKLAGYLVLAGVVASILSTASKFAQLIDSIGQKFGNLKVLGKDFQNTIAASSVEAVRLGASVDDIVSSSTTLASNFGLTIDEAAMLSSKVLDTSKALGLSADEGANLFGVLMQTSNLSATQAERLAESTFQLARQRGVAPSQVMRDIAGSAETIADFTKDGGDNIAEAAIQARSLGVSLETSAKVAKSLLDFESSVAAEVEASVLLGRQLNFQKARELALNNDISGAMSDVISQLGSEGEFNRLNLIQREALAKSIGVSTAELAKFVGESDKANAAGAAAGKSFQDLLGKDAISNISQLANTFASMGQQLVITVGPAISFIAGALAGLAGIIQSVVTGINQVIPLSQTLVGVLTLLAGKAVILAGKQLFLAATFVAEAVAKMTGITAGFGAPAAIAMGLATAAGIGTIISLISRQSVGDLKFDAMSGALETSPNEGAIVSIPGKGVFQGTPNDSVQMGPIAEPPQILPNFGTQSAMENSFGFKDDIIEGFKESLASVNLTTTIEHGDQRIAITPKLGGTIT